MILLNEIDEKLTAAGLNTRIVFISYTDTTWAPLEEKIKNPDRFTMLFAPIYRSFAYSMPEGKGKTELKPYSRNKNVFPNRLASGFDYFDQWLENWKEFRDYFKKINDALPFEYFSRDEASRDGGDHYKPEMAERISKIREITKEGRELIEKQQDCEYYVQSLALNLLRFHADFCDMISDCICAYALGNFDRACELCELARKELGKRESEFERFYDHYLYFTEYYWTLNYRSYVKDSAIII